MSIRSKVCLFGSSANPPTGEGGHVGIITAISKVAEFDEIRVIPVYRHTFNSKRNILESFHHRMEMCGLAFGSIDKVTVSNAEKRSFERMAQGLSEEEKGNLRVGTADLLEMLKVEEPNTDFSFCLGADTFLDLTSLKWRRSREVLELLDGRLVVFARKGLNIDTEKHISKVNEEMEGMRAIAISIPTLTDVSSSKVRSCTNEEELKKLLPNGVLEYIKKHSLYSFTRE